MRGLESSWSLKLLVRSGGRGYVLGAGLDEGTALGVGRG